jgi:NAD-dependent SIR2 family protein deacetylase
MESPHNSKFSKPTAVLCGAGVSFTSGLPLAKDCDALLRAYAADHDAQRDLPNLAKPSFNEDEPWLRFEGIMAVLQEYVDPTLSVLDVYTGGEVGFNHRALATIARNAPVLTTNFDKLIESAARVDGEPIAPKLIEADFEAEVSAGLWKLHGTLEVMGSTGTWQKLDADNERSPVATLPRISATRHSVVRKRFVHSLLKDYPLLIIGYSGIDDFDIGLWMREAQDVCSVRWIQKAKETDVRYELNASEYVGHDLAEPGIERLAKAWCKRGIGERLSVVITSRPEIELARNAGLCEPSPEKNKPTAPFSCNPGDEWEKFIVTGTLFSSISRYTQALLYLKTAVRLAGGDDGRKIKTLLALSDARQNRGLRSERREALAEVEKALSLKGDSYSEQTGNCIKLTVKALLPEFKEEKPTDHLFNLFEQWKNAPDRRLRSVAARAAVALSQRLRVGGGQNLERVRSFVQENGLLEAQFRDDHEEARNVWARARSSSEIQNAIKSLEQVVENSLLLGHIRQACASLNVLGAMRLRQADWPNHIFAPKRSEAFRLAREDIKRSKKLAEKHGLQWDLLQSELSLLFLALRINRDAKEAARLVKSIEAVIKRDDVQDPSDEWKWRFECAALNFLESHDLTIAASAAHEEFSAITTGLLPNAPGLIGRIRAAAELNAIACRSWRDSTNITFQSPQMNALIEPAKRDRSYYWAARVAFLDERRQAIKTCDEALSVLLDCGPPEAPEAVKLGEIIV